MNVATIRARFAPISVRHYVYLLVAVILALGSFLLGYLYWQNRANAEAEDIANHYHLGTVLYATQIKENVQRILTRHAENETRGGASSSEDQSVSHLYVIKTNLTEIAGLHDAFRHLPLNHERYDPVLQKALRQLDSIEKVWPEKGITANSSSRARAAQELRLFAHSIEQLGRLHMTSREELQARLGVEQAQATRKVVALFVIVLALGSLIVRKILSQIGRLMAIREQSEQKLRQSATVFENTKDGVLITDPATHIVAVNKAFTEITGYTREDALGKNPRMLMSGWQDERFYATMWDALTKTGGWQGEVWDRRKNGEIYPEWLTITAVQDGAGHLINYVGVFSDITRIKQSEEQLEHLAHYDPLTELPNRLLLHSRLAHALDRARRHGERLAVLFVDLDRFKNVNDSLGHPAGDELLQALAQRLSKRLRTEDTLARLGGDEFIILLEQLEQPQDAATVAQDVLDALSEPFLLAGRQEIFMGCSIGISLYPDDGLDTTQLVRNADAAMYQAKERGRNTYQFYTEALTRVASQRLAMETHMRHALECGEFVVYYQPQLCVATGRIVAAEALVRWQHPDEGLISPARFIPVAEETGLITPLGEWVLRTACAQLRAWQAAGLPPFTVAVNLSTRQFLHHDLARRIQRVLEDSGLEPSFLQLEITESALMEQGEHVTATLQALKALGITLSMDDFGTGYSSLAYLKRFDIDKLKIDRSFVRDITDNPSDAAMAASIIAMARKLRLQVIAEGVETDAQLAFLEAHGCHEYQGYLYSPALPADEFVQLEGLNNQRIQAG